jgi:hypothetical protein
MDQLVRFVGFTAIFSLLGYGFQSILLNVAGLTSGSWTAVLGDGSLFLVALALASGALASAIDLKRGVPKSILVVALSLVLTSSAFGFALAASYIGDEQLRMTNDALDLHNGTQKPLGPNTLFEGPSGGPEVVEELREEVGRLRRVNDQLAAALSPHEDDDSLFIMWMSMLLSILSLICAGITAWTKEGS